MQTEQLKGGNYYHIYNRGNNRSNLFSIPADFEHFLGLYDKYISPVADTLAWVLMPNHIHLLVKIKQDVVYKYSLSAPIANKLINAVGWEKWFAEHKWETIDLSANNLSANDLSAYAVPDNVEDVRNKTAYAVPYNVETGDLTSSFTAPDNLEKTEFDNVEVEKESNADRSIDAVGLKIKRPVPHRHFSHLFNAYTRYYHNRTGGCGNLFERPFKRIQIDNDEYLKRVILYIHNNPVHHGYCNHPLEYSWSSYISCISDKPTKLKREAVANLFGSSQKFKTEHLKPVESELMDKWLDVDIDYGTDINNLTDSDLSAYAVPDNVKGLKQPTISDYINKVN